MNKWIEWVVGLIFLVVAVGISVSNLWGFGEAVLIVLKGAILLGVALIGLLLIVLGISDLKN